MTGSGLNRKEMNRTNMHTVFDVKRMREAVVGLDCRMGEVQEIEREEAGSSGGDRWRSSLKVNSGVYASSDIDRRCRFRLHRLFHIASCDIVLYLAFAFRSLRYHSTTTILVALDFKYLSLLNTPRLGVTAIAPLPCLRSLWTRWYRDVE